MTGPSELLVDRTLLRELARLGNLLDQLVEAVRGGALCGDPTDAADVLRMLGRIEHRLLGLADEGSES